MNTRYRFPPESRLLKPAEFKAIFDSATFKVGDQQFLLLARPNELGRPRLGLVIAKKKLKLAVERNRIKRQSREAFRLQQYALPAVDLILIARDGLSSTDNTSFRQALLGAFKRLAKKAKSAP